jgi:glycine cleavage system H protein
MANETLDFMGTCWLSVEDNIVTIGVNEDTIDSIDKIEKVVLPTEGESVETDDICGELETSDGPVNIFAPISGRVVEVNANAAEDPEVIMNDPYEDGWLFRIEADNEDEIAELINGTSSEH